MVWCVPTENMKCFENLKTRGLKPDYMFRGTRVSDGKKVVIKAAHLCSREYDVIRTLSSPPLRDDPMNHTMRWSFPFLSHELRLRTDDRQLYWI